MRFDKLPSPHFIDQHVFNKLRKREKAYIYMIYVFKKKYTQRQMMDRLFIDTDRSYQRLLQRVRSVIVRQNVVKGKDGVAK